ncbi:MAG: helix-turn-helix domain-containing protein [Ruminococcaceae bacterium]|nr:helix-turn-helix domain-containing protein [Oscillospiraceae bacterium]
MHIVYRQKTGEGFLESVGIFSACVKQIDLERDVRRTTKKEHYHTSYELHIIEKGTQSYTVDDVEYTLRDGCFLLLPPRKRHCAKSFAPHTKKVSFTFELLDGEMLSEMKDVLFGTLDEEARECIARFISERRQKDGFADRMLACFVFESIVRILRLCGVTGNTEKGAAEEEDIRLTMAKQYISDNIEFAPTISEIADYCHLSTKQLSRIFCDGEGITPTEYIRSQRIERIQTLLVESELALSKISELMHFPNEYYFNTFFKRLAGMPPGEYRKMRG